MSSLYKSPGVHIESAGDRYIPLERVETGITAFLGATAAGPRHEPTRVGSFEQYEKVFGASDDYMTHGVRGFFDNGGRTAYVVNVAPQAASIPPPTITSASRERSPGDCRRSSASRTPICWSRPI